MNWFRAKQAVVEEPPKPTVAYQSKREWQLESFIRWASNASIAVHETGDKLIVIPLNDEQMDEYRLALKRVTQERWARNL